MSIIIEQAQAVGFDIISVVAGLGLFLFGINSIGDELKNIAGTRLKTIIDKYTTNPFKGLIVGIVVTALIQSSSATTALVISLIRSGLMSFTQALAVTMGANIGTTITAIMIGFNLSAIAPYAILIGAGIELFANNKKTRSYARLLIFFGILFFGLDLMGDGLKVLSKMPIFEQFALTLSHNKYYGLALGILMTMLIQSSSATIGILQTLYGQGALGLSASLPILLGNNIGTTITGVIAAVGGGVESKKTAFFHTFINVIGSVLFMAVMPLFTNVVQYVASVAGLNKMMEIAFAHFFFNAVSTLLLFPFLGTMEKMINAIFKGNGKDSESVGITTIFEKSIITESPVMALEIAHNGTLEMAKNCQNVFDYTKQFILEGKEEAFDSADQYEELVNTLNRSLSEYLVDISGEKLDDYNGHYLNFLIYTIKDLERIGDHLMNVNNHFVSIYAQKEELSDFGRKEIGELLKHIEILLNDLYAAIDEPNRYIVDRIYGVEDEINKYEEYARYAFIDRLKNRVPMGATTMALYVDILSDFERVGDYATNIANRIKDSLLI